MSFGLRQLWRHLDQNPHKLDVILYQLVTLKESGEQVRMSKRAGKIVSLRRCHRDGRSVMLPVSFILTAKRMPIWNLILISRLKHTDENPVYYIQYAYVRTGSILTKAQEHSSLRDISARDTTKAWRARSTFT